MKTSLRFIVALFLIAFCYGCATFRTIELTSNASVLIPSQGDSVVYGWIPEISAASQIDGQDNETVGITYVFEYSYCKNKFNTWGYQAPLSQIVISNYYYPYGFRDSERLPANFMTVNWDSLAVSDTLWYEGTNHTSLGETVYWKAMIMRHPDFLPRSPNLSEGENQYLCIGYIDVPKRQIKRFNIIFNVKSRQVSKKENTLLPPLFDKATIKKRISK